MDLLASFKDIGVPVAAVVAQAVLTWAKVRDQGKKIERMEETMYGNGDGLVSRVKILEHDAGRHHA